MLIGETILYAIALACITFLHIVAVAFLVVSILDKDKLATLVSAFFMLLILVFWLNVFEI